MNSLSFSSSSSSHLRLLLFSLLFIMPLFPLSHSNPELLKYDNCRNKLFKCGKINVGYPFSGGDRIPECGRRGLELRCDDHNTTIEILGVKYRVMDIHHDRHILRIAREDLINNGFCGPQIPIQDSIIDYRLFDLASAPAPAPGYTNATLFYDCQSLIPSGLGLFPCNSSNYKNVSVTTDNISGHGCVANVSFPIFQSSWEKLQNNSSLLLILEEALKTGFELQWKEDKEACRKCIFSGGACGFGVENQTICYCDPFGFYNSPDVKECHGLDPSTSPGSKSKSKQNLIFIGLAVAVTTAIALVSTICLVVLRFKGKSLSIHKCQGKMKDNARIEAFIKRFGSLALRRYFYGEIKKMTNKFNDKLGQGGRGNVYKGKLPDGRLVAVKVLSESKGNEEDFMNEIASISRTSHVNIVTLLGFCFERSKRVLVYEFMFHGLLDRFIHNQGSYHQTHRLEWKTLYDITLGIARGLDYLHKGCNTRILHFDIKPHNILLDENFCPKISDFGLSKLCERNESIISMACARGTIGYIAPEMFCRNFGRVSYKSDVYSYGMMVLEMIGERKYNDVAVSQTSEVYFRRGFISIWISL